MVLVDTGIAVALSNHLNKVKLRNYSTAVFSPFFASTIIALQDFEQINIEIKINNQEKIGDEWQIQ
jgi:hypothetical protein